MRPAEVLDMQADFMSRLSNLDYQKMFTSACGVHDGHADRNAWFAAQVMPNLHHVARRAHAYRVTEDMSRLVQHAANSLDDEDLFAIDAAPTRAGFVRFDRPLPIRDIRGTTAKAHFFLWCYASSDRVGSALIPGERAIVVSFFNDTRDPDDMYKAALAAMSPTEMDRVTRIQGRFSPIGLTAYFDNQHLGPLLVAPPDLDSVISTNPRFYEDNPLSGEELSEQTNVGRYVHALFLLLNQTITSKAAYETDRASAKRMRRMKLPTAVTVIDLRRTESHAAHGESSIEYDHRWITRGHWRWQPCGPGLTERRRIWINPYVKGPADKPLIVTDKVYNLAR